MIFSGAGYQPCLFDVDLNQLTRALELTREALQQYEEKGFLRGQGSAKDQADRILTTTSLEECLKGAFYVQVKTVFILDTRHFLYHPSHLYHIEFFLYL